MDDDPRSGGKYEFVRDCDGGILTRASRIVRMYADGKCRYLLQFLGQNCTSAVEILRYLQLTWTMHCLVNMIREGVYCYLSSRQNFSALLLFGVNIIRSNINMCHSPRGLGIYLSRFERCVAVYAGFTRQRRRPSRFILCGGCGYDQNAWDAPPPEPMLKDTGR